MHSRHGTYVPDEMIFNFELPAAVLLTLIRLYALSENGSMAHVYSMQELVKLMGQKRQTLARHVKQLQASAALIWRLDPQGRIMISFTNETQQEMERLQSYSNPHVCERGEDNPAKSTQIASYFPKRILGYISYQSDDD